MKKLTALLLCLVLCVSMFAACGEDEPADTTKSSTPSTTEGTPSTTKPDDTDPTGPSSSQNDPDSSNEDPGDDFEPVDLSDYIPDYPETEKLALEALGAKDAGVVEAGYTTVLENATGIATLEEITDPYGVYYLTADISANAHTVPEFYGALDACGHSITTSEPLFNVLGGGILNLNLAGDITYSAEAKGTLANTILSYTTILNVKNTCNVTVNAESTQTNVLAGGFAINVYGEYVVFGNCEFAGEINNVYNIKDNGRKSGGFVALITVDPSSEDAVAPVVDFINCTFSGELTASSHCAGLVGEAVTMCTISIAGCVNTGTVANTKEGYAGGLLAYLNGAAPGILSVINCANNGTVTSEANIGGIIGSSTSDTLVHENAFKWCTNYKDIVCRTTNAGGIAGRIKGLGSFTECVNFGDINGLVPKNADGQEDPTAARHYFGGIYGMSAGAPVALELTDCINYGDLNAYASNCRLGGVSGHGDSTPLLLTRCINFGDITSNYVEANAEEPQGQCRLGGLSAVGTGGTFSFYDCVNFGDVKHSMGSKNQPTGGLVAYLPNSGGSTLVNCMNYGDVDVTSAAGPCVGGIAGWVTGNAFVVMTGCINAGALNSSKDIGDLLVWRDAEVTVEGMLIENNYYLPAYTGSAPYAPIIHNDGTTPGRSSYSDKCTQIEKSTLEDGTPVGLAATMSAKTSAYGDAAEFKCVEIQINEVEKMTCVVPATILELIADNIVA